MALQVADTKRKFIYKQKASQMDLDDPGTAMTPNQVLDFYSAAYPDLTTAKVEGPAREVGKDGEMLAVYTFSTSIGTKG